MLCVFGAGSDGEAGTGGGEKHSTQLRTARGGERETGEEAHRERGGGRAKLF